MRDVATPYFVGLDIGTAYVRCVIGTISEAQDTSRMSIIGHGQAPNVGMRKGVVVHVEDVAEAIIQAVTEAERISGKSIKEATVNINGGHILGMNSKGVIAISTANKEITPQDRQRVEETATIIQIPANREIIQGFTKSYSVDGLHNVKNPVGMQGVRLEVDMHLVTAASPNLQSLDLALQRSQIASHHHTVSGLGGAEAVLTRQQKEAGTAVIDIGAGTTNIVIVEDGEIQHVAVLPVGGQHVTNDLAIGLKTELDIAEAVKLQYGQFLDKQTLNVSTDSAEYSFPIEQVRLIIESRLEELFEYVDKELNKVHRSRKLPGGIAIVGGSANIPGIADIAKDKLELAVRIGRLKNIAGLVDTVDTPAFASAVGLMLLDMLLGDHKDTHEFAQNNPPGHLMDRLLRVFRG